MRHTPLAVAILLVPAVAPAADPVDYAKHVRPVLQERCFACHGVLQQKGKLRLDGAANLLKGGASGPVVVPGKPGESDLLARVTAKDDAERMPPEGHPLKPAEVAALRAWVEQGAKVPAADPPEPDPRDHWAFRTPVRPPVPANPGRGVNNPIDAFVLAKLGEKGLQPVGPADRRVLLRRVYLDLIGLPPTPEQTEAFLKDTSPGAYEKVVDQLLASPQYGERWGRHFLDIWRYSDWWGLGAELRNSQKHIWHWRDWTIESLNADLGYDEMLRQMLAADELYPTDPQKLRATGYLARPYFLFNRTSWLDEVIEHTGKGMLGLTANCSKCHDHKYDPVTQLDYYRLRAVFEPYQVRTDMVGGETDFEKAGMPRAFDANPKAVTPFHVRGDERNTDKGREVLPGLPGFLAPGGLKIEPVKLPREAYTPGLRPEVAAAYRAAAEKAAAAARDQLAKAKKDLAAAEEAAAKAPPPPPEKPAPAVAPAAGKRAFGDDFAKPNPDLWDAGPGMWKHENGRLLQQKAGDGRSVLTARRPPPADFDARFRFTITGGTPYRSVGFSFDRGGDNEVMVYVSASTPGSKLQVTYKAGGKDYAYPQDGAVGRPIPVGQPIELGVKARGGVLNVSLDGRHALAYRLPVPRKPGAAALVTYTAAAEFLAFEVSELPVGAKLVEPGGAAVAAAPAGGMTVAAAKAALAVAEKAVAAAAAEVLSVEARAKAAPDAAKAEKQAALAAADLAAARAESDVANAAPAQKAAAEKKLTAARTALAAARKAAENPGTAFTPLRGAVKSKESNLDAAAAGTTAFPDTSTGRRAAFAKWLTDPANPLTARVVVNHVWARHVGRPLVPTVFDFGRKGTPPTHPELLDWLACELMSPSPLGGEGLGVRGTPPARSGSVPGRAADPSPPTPLPQGERGEKAWSLKHLHKLIVTSATYQRSSSALGADAAAAADPENRHLWRMNPVRMEAQVVRDSLLSLAGELDLAAGGPPVPLAAQDASRRRSLYFFHSHNEHNKLLGIFDDANVLDCYRRTESIVPQQALALSNSKFALSMAEKIAPRIAPAADDAGFVAAAFGQLLGNAPTPAERAACADALKEFREAAKDLPEAARGARARVQLVQALLNHNDFVTVR